MPLLSTQTLARLRKAVQRGEHCHTDETRVLGLPILQPAPCATDAPLFSITGTDTLFAPERRIVGSLLLTPDALYREADDQASSLMLSAMTPLHLRLSEPILQTTSANVFGVPIRLDHQIQAGSWPAYSVRFRHAHEQQRLLPLLKIWYEQRIPLTESYRGARAFLLNPHMSYEEIQAFKRQYGIGLHG